MTTHEREIKFDKDISEAVIDLSEYQIPGKMVKDFFEYWTELNKSCTKMKFELEKTWDTKRRLKRWYDNNKKWNNGKANNGSLKGNLLTTASKADFGRL